MTLSDEPREMLCAEDARNCRGSTLRFQIVLREIRLKEALACINRRELGTDIDQIVESVRDKMSRELLQLRDIRLAEKRDARRQRAIKTMAKEVYIRLCTSDKYGAIGRIDHKKSAMEVAKHWFEHEP